MKNITKQFSELRKLENPILDKKEKDLLTIEDLKKNSFFIFNKNLYRVVSISFYEEKSGSKWFELECYSIYEDKITYFEYEKDDYIEVSITLKELSMRDLDKDIDQIEEISEEEEGSLYVNGKEYEYEDDYGAKWHKEGSDSYKVYFYDFIASDNELLTVEEWKISKNKYEYKVYLSKEIRSEDITVISI